MQYVSPLAADFVHAELLARKPARRISVDRGNGSLVAVTRQAPGAPLRGVALTAATTRPRARAYDASDTRSQEIRLDLMVAADGQAESFVLNPERLQDAIAAIGDVELGTPLYVAQHLALAWLLCGPQDHLEMLFGCPFHIWQDAPRSLQLKDALKGLHRYTINGVELTTLISPRMMPQPVMAAGCLTMPNGVPDPRYAGKLIGIIDPGTGSDDYVLLRGVKAEQGRAGGDSGTRALAEVCELLWELLKADTARFPMLKRTPYPGVHAMLRVLDTQEFEYNSNPVPVSGLVHAAKIPTAKHIVATIFGDSMWGRRWNEIAAIGIASGGGRHLRPAILDLVERHWHDKLLLIEPEVQPIAPDPLNRGTSVYGVAAGGYYFLEAQELKRQAQGGGSVAGDQGSVARARGQGRP